MVVLVICAVVAWARNGSGQLRDNWRSGTRASGSSPARVIREIFNGICLGALGMTGFECKFILVRTKVIIVDNHG